MKIDKIIYIVLFCFLVTSCNKWLTIQPTDQVSEETLYSTAEGYHNQVNGVYRTMASASLYGRELTWGVVDALGQSYDYAGIHNAMHPYSQGAKEYNYEDKFLQPLIEDLWEEMFNAIANCNDIIAHAEKADPMMFYNRELEKNLILGEAHALRAMLHFDILRLFAPAPIKNRSEKLIPYVTVFPTKIPMPMDTKEVLKNIIADLEKGEQLTAEFDIFFKDNILDVRFRLESYTSGGGQRFTNSRGYRLNHYAIKALIARVCMYAGDDANKEKALKYAEELIALNKFKFTSSYYFGKGNIKLYDDVIFALHSNKYKDIYSYINKDSKLGLSIINFSDVYGADTKDLRAQQWLYDTSTKRYLPLKILHREGSGGKEIYNNRLLPILRISEMYYIAAECLFGRDKTKATSYLKIVKTGRSANTNISDALNQSDFNRLILDDARREFMCEGQIFFFYKRLNLPVRLLNNEEKALDEEFVLPIPPSNDIN